MSWNLRADLSDSLCINNFNRIRDSFTCQDGIDRAESFDEKCGRLLLTIAVDASQFRKIPVLSEASRYLLSSADKLLGTSIINHPRWKMGAKIGLHRYVSAYCGIHDPLNSCSLNPIGFFLMQDCNVHDVRNSNVAYRDCYSGHVRTETEMKELFLRPMDARQLMKLDVSCHHGGDIWKYWGMPNKIFLEDAGEIEKEGRPMYNTFERIETSRIMAVIYPEHTIVGDGGFEQSYLEDDPDLKHLIDLIGSEPEYYFYKPGDDPMESLVTYSYYICKNWVENNSWPLPFQRNRFGWLLKKFKDMLCF